MSTTTRRRYRFRSRELAEEAERIQSHRAHLLYRGMRALERGEITWTTRRGLYQVGLYDLDGPTGPRCLVRYWGNGEVETDAHDFEDWASQWENYRFPDAEISDLRRLAEEGRYIIHQHESRQQNVNHG